jgi:hypothetical protein
MHYSKLPKFYYCKNGCYIDLGETLAITKGTEGIAIPNMGKHMIKQEIQTRVDLCKCM